MGYITGDSITTARRMMDGFDADSNLQTAGRVIGEKLEETEDAIMKKYQELGSADATRSKVIEGEIQSLSIKLKRVQTMMELFQQIVKSHFETMLRAIQNINVRS